MPSNCLQPPAAPAGSSARPCACTWTSCLVDWRLPTDSNPMPGQGSAASAPTAAPLCDQHPAALLTTLLPVSPLHLLSAVYLCVPIPQAGSSSAAGRPAGSQVQMISDNDLFKPAAPAKPKASLRLGMGQPKRVSYRSVGTRSTELLFFHILWSSVSLGIHAARHAGFVRIVQGLLLYMRR